MIKVIGLHGIATDSKGNRIGSARVGKDEVALTLKERGFYHTSFAKPMYKIVNEVYGIDTSSLTHYDKEVKIYKPWGMTLRQILQSIGDKFRRDDPEFFLKCLMVDIKNNCAEHQRTIVSDVRYQNEADFIREISGVICHVTRPLPVENYAINPHSSEVGVAIDTKDLRIFNRGTLQDLKNSTIKLDEVTTPIGSHHEPD